MPFWINALLYIVVAVGAFVASVQAFYEGPIALKANVYGIFVTVMVLVGVVAILDQAAVGEHTGELFALFVGFGLPGVRHMARWRLAQSNLPQASGFVRLTAGFGIHVLALLAAVALGDWKESALFCATYLLLIADEALRPSIH